eukprot:scaffold19768_cov128-Isochrysis_galbana.AAC.4
MPSSARRSSPRALRCGRAGMMGATCRQVAGLCSPFKCVRPALAVRNDGFVLEVLCGGIDDKPAVHGQHLWARGCETLEQTRP